MQEQSGLPVGQELDDLIAAIDGYTITTYTYKAGPVRVFTDAQGIVYGAVAYSGNLGEAMDVADRFAKATGAQVLAGVQQGIMQEHGRYYARIQNGAIAYGDPSLTISVYSHESVAHALCLALVRAQEGRRAAALYQQNYGSSAK